MKDTEELRTTRLVKAVRWMQWELVFIAVGGVLGLLLVAYRGEVLSDSIQDQRYESCAARQAQLVAYNDRIITALVPALRTSPPVRDDVTQALLFPIPVCPPDPTP